MQNYLYLDLETRAKVDLSEAGLDNYSRVAEVLMLGWAINDRKVRVWFPTKEEIPAELLAAIQNPDIIKIAWNSGFERTIFRQVLKIDIPINQFRDAMILARSLSMPGKLDSVCDILKIGKDEAKLKDGSRLLKLFTEPSGKGGEETLFGITPEFNDEISHPVDWKQLVDYCVRDVEVERMLWLKMLPLSFPEEQWEDWFLSEEINETGLPVNVERAKKALRLAERYKEESRQRLNELTGLANANSTQQLLPWLEARGYTWGSVNKTYVDSELNNPNSKLTKEAREVLELRRKSSQSSYTKLERIVAQVSPDGFLRHQFAFMGASRTGRWSSNGAQVQNLPRPIKAVEKNPERALELLDAENYDQILKEYGGSTLPFVASCLRMMFSVECV